MFNNIQEKDLTNGGGKFKLPYFFNLVKITGVEFKDSATNKTQVKLELEGKSDDPDFKGFDRLDGTKAKGPLATVDLGIYTSASDFDTVKQLMTNLSLISSKIGIDYKSKLMPIFQKAFNTDAKGNAISLKKETLDFLKQVITAIVKILTKGNYCWIFINAEEYAKGKFGNYTFKTYNSGTKKNKNFLIWIKSEACVIETFSDDKDERITIGVKGINAVGNNKGDSFDKMREVGNHYELKPYEELDANELDNDNLDADLGLSEVDDLPFGDDDLGL